MTYIRYLLYYTSRPNSYGSLMCTHCTVCRKFPPKCLNFSTFVIVRHTTQRKRNTSSKPPISSFSIRIRSRRSRASIHIGSCHTMWQELQYFTNSRNRLNKERLCCEGFWKKQRFKFHITNHHWDLLCNCLYFVQGFAILYRHMLSIAIPVM